MRHLSRFKTCLSFLQKYSKRFLGVYALAFYDQLWSCLAHNQPFSSPCSWPPMVPSMTQAWRQHRIAPLCPRRMCLFWLFFEGKQRPRKRWDGGMSNGDIFESSHVIYAPFVGRTLWQWSLLIRLMVLKIPFDPLWNKCNDEWEMNIRDLCSTCSTLQRGLCLSGGGVGGGGLSPSVLWAHQLYHLSVLPFAAPWLLHDSKSVV